MVEGIFNSSIKDFFWNDEFEFIVTGQFKALPQDFT
jgi:hypothetical protein